MFEINENRREKFEIPREFLNFDLQRTLNTIMDPRI